MKQTFNTDIATKYGVRSAVIVSLMIDFCRSAANSDDYKFGGKVFVPYFEIRRFTPYMNTHDFGVGLNNLINHNIIQHVRPTNNRNCYMFTDHAKELFSKKPIRIQIDWQ